jgi:hypothetical protein
VAFCSIYRMSCTAQSIACDAKGSPTGVPSSQETSSTLFRDGGDAYVMKFIIHDWDDGRAIRILHNCRHAMGTEGRLLVIERVLSAGDEPDFGKLSDLQMLVFTPSGRERTEAEFRALYEAAGSQLTSVIPTTSPLSIIEGVPK